MMKARVCIISPWHPANNPRVVKEARALHEAGCAVHVVAGRHFAPMDAADAALLSGMPWRCTRVDCAHRWTNIPRRACRRLLRMWLARFGWHTLDMAGCSHFWAWPLLAEAAAAVPSDLYIGHAPSGLCAAAEAARRNGAPFAFDAEEYHPGETGFSVNDPAEHKAIGTIEQTLLPRCACITAASPMIARAYAARYGIATPQVVLNAFPLSDAPAQPAGGGREPGAPASFYWFSQTIGPGRGLEAVLGIVRRMRNPARVRLRGSISPSYASHLRELLPELRSGAGIDFLPPGPPGELVRLAAEHDLGLSPEEHMPPNRDVCLTNRVFAYLLAGIPVLLTPTMAQEAFARQLGVAALLLDTGRAAEAAAALDTFVADPERRGKAAAAARRLAQERYNWEQEKQGILSAVAVALGRPLA